MEPKLERTVFLRENYLIIFNGQYKSMPNQTSSNRNIRSEVEIFLKRLQRRKSLLMTYTDDIHIITSNTVWKIYRSNNIFLCIIWLECFIEIQMFESIKNFFISFKLFITSIFAYISVIWGFFRTWGTMRVGYNGLILCMNI